MAIDRKKLIRYRVYDQCFSNFTKMYTRSMLCERVNEALRAANLEEVGQSTVNHDISPNGNFASDMCPEVDIVAYKCMGGIESNKCLDDIENNIGIKETTYYRYAEKGYSIWKVDLDETQVLQLQNALLMLNQFKGLPNMDWVQDLMESLCKRYNLIIPETDAVVELDYNPDLTGLDSFFSPILNATLQKSALNITYNGGYEYTYQDTIHPYYIKEYNNRWFVYGWSEKFQRINNMAIDRFIAVAPSAKIFQPNTHVDFSEYFDDIVGVTRYADVQAQLIRLRFTPQRYNYVVTKPIHGLTQRNYDDRYEITIEVRPNRELEALILSYGGDVEVLEPQSLRDTIAEKIQQMYSTYSQK